jgi:hypothetical protein
MFRKGEKNSEKRHKECEKKGSWTKKTGGKEAQRKLLPKEYKWEGAKEKGKSYRGNNNRGIGVEKEQTRGGRWGMYRDRQVAGGKQ